MAVGRLEAVLAVQPELDQAAVRVNHVYHLVGVILLGGCKDPDLESLRTGLQTRLDMRPDVNSDGDIFYKDFAIFLVFHGDPDLMLERKLRRIHARDAMGKGLIQVKQKSFSLLRVCRMRDVNFVQA